MDDKTLIMPDPQNNNPSNQPFVSSLSPDEKRNALYAALGLGGIGLAAGGYYLWDKHHGDDTHPNPPEQSPKPSTPPSTPSSVPVPVFEHAPIAKGSNDSMAFEDAFRSARKEVGAGGVFRWHGKVYDTYIDEEWKAMTPEQKVQYQKSVGIQEEPYHPAPQEPGCGGSHESPPKPPPVILVANPSYKVGDKFLVGNGLMAEAIDSTGNGRVDSAIVRDAQGNKVGMLLDRDENGVFEEGFMDTNGDGQADKHFIDKNGDGKFETIEDLDTPKPPVPSVPPPESPKTPKVGERFDVGGGLTAVAKDASGDGIADSAVVQDDSGKVVAVLIDKNQNGKYEEMMVDKDGDGQLDVRAIDANEDGQYETTEPLDTQKPQPPGQPTEPPGQPTEPPGQPTEPPGQPTEPPGQPTEPPGQPTEPPGQPTGQKPGDIITVADGVTAVLVDESGDGIVDGAILKNAEGGNLGVMVDENQNGVFEKILLDTNKDGTFDRVLLDADEDGRIDEERPLLPQAPGDVVITDDLDKDTTGEGDVAQIDPTEDSIKIEGKVDGVTVGLQVNENGFEVGVHTYAATDIPIAVVEDEEDIPVAVVEEEEEPIAVAVVGEEEEPIPVAVVEDEEEPIAVAIVEDEEEPIAVAIVEDEEEPIPVAIVEEEEVITVTVVEEHDEVTVAFVEDEPNEVPFEEHQPSFDPAMESPDDFQS
jgi:hypothetical protein